MSRFKLLYFVIFIINLCRINAQISDKRLCVDEECKVPISLAKTLLRYSSPDSRILSFAPNVDITIYSKSAGSRTDLWGGEIDGKRGYIPKHMVRETKILKKPTLLVDTEFNNDTETTQVPSQVEPDKVQEPYEVVDGTTIFTNPEEEIEPTSTAIPMQSTALPARDAPPGKTETPEVVSSEQPSKDTEKVDETEAASNEEEIAPKKTANAGQTSEEKNEETASNEEEITPKQTATDSQASAEKDEEMDVAVDDDAEDDDDIEDEDDDDDDDDEDEVEQSERKADVSSEKEGDLELPEREADAVSFEKKGDVELAERKADAVSSEKKGDIESSEEPMKTSEEPAFESSAEIKSKEKENSEEILSAIKSEASTTNDTAQVEVTREPSEESVKVPYSADVNPEIAAIVQKEVAIEESSVGKEEVLPKKEEAGVVAPKIEVTTFSPEIEVPHPFADSLAEVTPNPVETVSEEVKIVENIIPVSPPLGLFGQNLDSASSEEVVTESAQISDEISNKTEDTPQPIDLNNENVDAVTEFSFEDESQEMFEKNQSEELHGDGNKETQDTESVENKTGENDSGFLSGFMSMFETDPQEKALQEAKVIAVEAAEESEVIAKEAAEESEVLEEEPVEENKLTSDHDVTTDNEEVIQKSMEAAEEFISRDNIEQFCDAESCRKPKEPMESDPMDFFLIFNSDVFLYLVTTAVSVIIFLFGYIAFDKSKREGPLVAKINILEKELLIVIKENQILQDRISGESGYETNDRASNEVVENLKLDLLELTNVKNALEEQVQSLEKELENSTEVGMELNRMLSEILSSESGSDVLKANVEHLQRQLVEQQVTINSISETLAITNTENHEVKLELDLSNKKVVDLQAELDKLLLNVLKIEEEKEAQQASLENEVATYKKKFEETYSKLRSKEEEYSMEVKQLKNRLIQTERNLELKMKELEVLAETVKQLKAMKSNDGPTLQSLLDVSGVKAELQLLTSENQKFSEKLRLEEEAKLDYQKTAETAVQEVQRLKEKYDEADRLKVETETKLEVLSNYFKDREAQLQKEISKHESLWVEKQGEATSTTERIKFMQEQLQNYKAQTESLKQEIMSQEVELKSQISVLEKKAHENWVSARQAERKLEEAKQEAAQLRHRLTLRERAIQEDKNPHRYQSPIEQNGDMPVSPLESPASPPLLYGTRDHITKSPAIPGLPPFLPPPPGVPFMPPPLHGVPPFIPPPPTMYPGDHRPPPLGRMSSPPLNSRYSPSSRGYSPYDSSPSDSEYGTSPPQRRGYSPFNSRDDPRDYKRPQRPPPGRTNGRNIMKGGGSSGSGHSNESLEKINRQQSKV